MYTVPQMPQETLPTQAKPFPSFWSLIKSSFHTWHDAWGLYSLVNLAVVIAGTLASYFIVKIIPWVTPIFRGEALDATVITAHYPSLSPLVYDLVGISALLLLFICFIIISQLVTILATDRNERQQGIGYLISESFHLVPHYVWSTAVLSLIITAGFVLLFIPGLLFIPIVVTGIFVAAKENKTGLDVAVQSSSYVRGRVLPVLWRSLLIIVVIQGVSLLLPVFAALLVYPFTLLKVSAHTLSVLTFTAGTLYTFVSLILSLIMPSLLIFFYYHLYIHMRDNPTGLAPLDRKMLSYLAWFGVVAIVGFAALEVFLV